MVVTVEDGRGILEEAERLGGREEEGEKIHEEMDE